MGSLVLPFLFWANLVAAMKEGLMHQSIRAVFLLLLLFGLAACAKPPAKVENSPETQRSHAQGAQDELSSEVHK